MAASVTMIPIFSKILQQLPCICWRNIEQNIKERKKWDF